MSKSIYGFIFLLIISLFFCVRPAYASEAAPLITPSYQVFSSGPQPVSISDTDGAATIYYTVTAGSFGTTPTTGSTVYSGSFNVTQTSTIESIAVGTGGTSAVTTSTVQIDPSTANVLPISGQILWLKTDNGIVLSGTNNLQSWIDVSGIQQYSEPEHQLRPTIFHSKRA